MKIGIGSQAQDTDIRIQDMSFTEFAEKLAHPKVGSKNGLYVIRGGNMKQPKRGDENLLEAELLIIDGDSRFDPSSGEIESGAPDFDVTQAAFEKLGIAYALHTTHSNAPGKPKWRAYVPAHMRDQGELAACVTDIIERLNGLGCFVVQTKECSTWSQAWFTPRVPTDEALAWFRHAASTDRAAFDVAGACNAQAKRTAAEAAASQKQEAPKPAAVQHGPSPIEMFNAAATLGTVRYMLEQAGYKFAFRRGDTMRFIAPGSESGTPGVTVFKGALRGDVVIYSHHGAHDPLSGRLNDAFGALCRLRHGGDQEAALAEAKAVIGWKQREEPALEWSDVEITAEDFERAPKQPAAASGPLFIRAAEFAASWQPAEYLVDGIIQRGYCYSLTSPTGHGKTSVIMLLAACIGTGRKFAGVDTLPGRVGYFAAENPNDVQARWIGMQETLAFADASVWFCPETINLADSYARITKEAEAAGGFDLIIVDTSQAFFTGEDENSNAQMVGHAKAMRKLTTLPGNPCVVILCHPVKNPARDNLLPRGGGGFLAEVDGNLSLWNDAGNLVMHHQGKFRGAGFAPINFTLKTVNPERLKDAKGRQIPTVVAEYLNEDQYNARLLDNASDQDRVMILIMNGKGKITIGDMARMAGWTSDKGTPHKGKVHRLLLQLRDAKLATVKRNGRWALTEAGKKEIAPRAKAMGIDAAGADDEPENDDF